MAKSSRLLDKVFRRYPNFLRTECGIGRRKLLCQKPAQFVQSFRHNTGLWRTDRQSHDDSMYHASIASRGKKTLAAVTRQTINGTSSIIRRVLAQNDFIGRQQSRDLVSHVYTRTLLTIPVACIVKCRLQSPGIHCRSQTITFSLLSGGAC